jgi:hypothetical protein
MSKEIEEILKKSDQEKERLKQLKKEHKNSVPKDGNYLKKVPNFETLKNK